MRRKQIIADYERRMDSQGKETYIYTGPLFSFDLTDRQLLGYRLFCWAVPALMIAAYISIGLLDTGSMRRFYAVFPFIALMMPLALLISDAYKLSTNPRRMQRKEYLRCVVQMRRCTVAVIILSALLILGQSGFLLWESVESARAEWLFLAGCVLICTMAIVFWSVQKRAKTTAHR